MGMTACSGGSRISHRRGRQPPMWGRQPIIWSKISRKLHENERIWTRGGRIPGAPLRSANGPCDGLICFLRELPLKTYSISWQEPLRLFTGFPLFSSDKIPWLFPDFSSISFIFPWLLLNIFSCPLFNIYFFMYGLHLLLGNCIKSLHALKYSFYNTQKYIYLTWSKNTLMKLK